MKVMLIVVILLLSVSTAHAEIQWSWVNVATGTEQGYFLTDGALETGLAPAGSYTISNFFLTASHYSLPVGSLLSGEYSTGQPSLGFDWDGSNVTVMWRSSGNFTNGFGLMVPGATPGDANYILFNVGYFSVEDYDGDITFIEEYVSASITPDSEITPTTIYSFDSVKSLFR